MLKHFTMATAPDANDWAGDLGRPFTPAVQERRSANRLEENRLIMEFFHPGHEETQFYFIRDDPGAGMDRDMHRQVLKNFTSLLNALVNGPLRFNCCWPKVKEPPVEHAIAPMDVVGKKWPIYVNRDKNRGWGWFADLSTQALPGAMVHEISHVVLKTDDILPGEAYGSGTWFVDMKLQRMPFGLAIRNADSYRRVLELYIMRRHHR